MTGLALSGRSRATLFFALAAACLLPWLGPAVALAAGILFSLLAGNPAPERTAASALLSSWAFCAEAIRTTSSTARR